MIRVGFVFLFDHGWLGGINYYRNLLTALYALPERKIEAVIFTGARSPESHFDGFPAVRIVRSRLFDKGSILWRIRQRVIRHSSRDFLFEWMLRLHGVSILSHSDWLPGNAQIPTVGWIPDFQHVHLPEYFSAEELAGRDEHYSNICLHCSTVIVSSFDAQVDLFKFSPISKGKSKVLQFVIAPLPTTTLPSHDVLESKYKCSGKYFLLPNQFWKHKNHSVVIEALGVLASQRKNVRVLATGKPEDYRHPQYFNSIINRAKELDILDNFSHIGIVSAEDLGGLMRDAIAIINPSYFEGWSTTVEEAKSLGKRVVLSDIPVHREQDPLRASYFSPSNPNELADILWSIWQQTNTTDEMTDFENEQRITKERRLEFAKKYQTIVLGTLEEFR